MIDSTSIPIRRFYLLLAGLAGLAQPTLAQPAGGTGHEHAVRGAVAAVADSVVQIRTVGGRERVDQQLVASGPTTGLIISSDGYVLSSSFNFVQQPTSILVRLPSGEQAPAELVATDHSRMLVLLKLETPSALPVPTFAPVDEVEVGAWAIAVGRTFVADRPNIAEGIVSARNRMFGRVLQSDAAMSLANYGGPLIDLRGRVMGLIVPMAPQGTSELAGAQWYDSGIGFAVPLAELTDRIERMKRGEDQYAGRMGLGLQAGAAHGVAPKVATVRPQSPADRAGIVAGDTIVAIDGEPVADKAALRFQVAPRYAGDTLSVTVARDDDRLELELTLAGPLGAYRHAFLGVLPMRTTMSSGEQTDSEPGVAVRAVYADSPAADAGLSRGDRIQKLDNQPVESVEAAILAMNNIAVGSEVELDYQRGEQQQSTVLTAVDLPTSFPDELPSAHDPAPEPSADADQAQVGTVDIRLPEFPHECRLHVPQSYQAGARPGVLLWLEPARNSAADDALQEWRPLCEEFDLLLVVPELIDKDRWSREELSYLRRLLSRVTSDYRVDRNRVVVHGRRQAGGLAYLFGIAGRKLVRGISVSAAPLPRGLEIPDAQPEIRLAVYSAQSESVARIGRVGSGHRELAAAGYPVTTANVADTEGRISDDERKKLVRWIDSLDRF